MESQKLDDAMTNLVLTVTNGIQQAGEFAADQLPEVIQQLIYYNIASCVVWLLFGLALLFASKHCIYWAVKAKKCHELPEGRIKERAETLYRVDFESWGWAVAALLIVFGLPFVLCNTFELIKLIFAPKVWLLEYAAHLVTGSK